MNVVGKIVTGGFEEVVIRQKEGQNIEIGDLLVVDNEESYTILQVFDLCYGSQFQEKMRTLMAGMKLEGHGSDLTFMDPALSNYLMAMCQSLVTVRDNKPASPKSLPEFFSDARSITDRDLDFIKRPEGPLHIGNIRSGSKETGVEVSLPGEEVLRHHVLIPASTGKGKSNLVKVMLYNSLDKDYCGFLVLDPHDEYYGRSSAGLSYHPDSDEKLVYYTPYNPPPGALSLRINLAGLCPWHLKDVINLTEAQIEASYTYYRKFKEDWIESLLKGKLKDENEKIKEATLFALQRKLEVHLDLEYKDDELICHGIFKESQGENTIRDICDAIEEAKTVVIDTSSLGNRMELMVGSIISQQLFSRYRKNKNRGRLDQKPVASIVIEEAPRVIGSNSVLQAGNVFESIAREGRKFKLGLIAITQLPSVIPKEILANMNTKIILGTEMHSERASIIESASQNLSKDDRNIASLDIGEAIITSPFTKFAIPVSIPEFEKIMEDKEENGQRRYPGLDIE